MNRLIATVGLPRSGKSTLIKDAARKVRAPIVSRDALRLAILGERYKSEAEPMIKTMSLYMIKALFLAGHDTVFYDETNYSQAARDAIKSDQWDTLFWEVDTDVNTCMRRAIDTDQADLAPVIYTMYKRREPLGPDDKVYVP